MTKQSEQARLEAAFADHERLGETLTASISPGEGEEQIICEVVVDDGFTEEWTARGFAQIANEKGWHQIGGADGISKILDGLKPEWTLPIGEALALCQQALDGMRDPKMVAYEQACEDILEAHSAAREAIEALEDKIKDLDRFGANFPLSDRSKREIRVLADQAKHIGSMFHWQKESIRALLSEIYEADIRKEGEA